MKENNRYRTRMTYDTWEGYPYWEVEDMQPNDFHFKRTGESLKYGPYWTARRAYNRCRQLNREEKRKNDDRPAV